MDAGGVPLTIASLSKHGAEEAVVDAASTLLFYLAQATDCRPAVLSAGGPAAIAAAMAMHDGSAAITSAFRDVLDALTGKLNGGDNSGVDVVDPALLGKPLAPADPTASASASTVSDGAPPAAAGRTAIDS